jgi:hypothetical protein
MTNAEDSVDVAKGLDVAGHLIMFTDPLFDADPFDVPCDPSENGLRSADRGKRRARHWRSGPCVSGSRRPAVR